MDKRLFSLVSNDNKESKSDRNVTIALLLFRDFYCFAGECVRWQTDDLRVLVRFLTYAMVWAAENCADTLALPLGTADITDTNTPDDKAAAEFLRITFGFTSLLFDKADKTDYGADEVMGDRKLFNVVYELLNCLVVDKKQYSRVIDWINQNKPYLTYQFVFERAEDICKMFESIQSGGYVAQVARPIPQ